MFIYEIMGPVLAGALVLMSALYLVAWKKKDAGLVDLGWTVGIGCAALYLAWRLDGGIRGWLIAGLAAHELQHRRIVGVLTPFCGGLAGPFHQDVDG